MQAALGKIAYQPKSTDENEGNMNSQKANSHAGGYSPPDQPTNNERNMNSIPKTSSIWPDATWRRCRLPYTLAPLFLLALACVTFPRNSLAQSDDFNSGNDTGWTRYDPLAAFGGGATFSFP